MLKVDNTNIELGKLRYGKPHLFKYIITNDFPSPLTINKLVTGCTSCTKAYTNKTYLKPGESSDINVTFTPGSRGKQLKSVSVVYNDNQSIQLKFTAEVD